MRTFHFRLATLLRMHEAARDQRRAELAEAFRAEEMLRARLAELQADLANLKADCRRRAQPGVVEIDRLIDSQRYEFLLLAQCETLKQQATTLAAEIERRRDALMAADREVRTLEKLREKQRQEHRHQEERLEVKLLDEVAARSHGGEHE